MEKNTIEMEQTTFIKKHAKKLIFGTAAVGVCTVAYLLKKHGVEINALQLDIKDIKGRLKINSEIAIKTLSNTIEQYEFEISELEFKKANLNDTQRNIFMNIPKINEEINLKTILKNDALEMLNKALETSKDCAK